MTKVKELKPTKKVQRVLGADIETATYEQLSETFDKVRSEFESKKYELSLSQESISLLLMDILPNVEWVGQQAWDIAEAQKTVTDLKPDKVLPVTKESVRALFQFVATNKYKGTDNVYQVSKLLTTLAEIIQNQIGVDEQVFRDAGFELQAAEMGITPERAMEDAIAAQEK